MHIPTYQLETYHLNFSKFGLRGFLGTRNAQLPLFFGEFQMKPFCLFQPGFRPPRKFEAPWFHLGGEGVKQPEVETQANQGHF